MIMIFIFKIYTDNKVQRPLDSFMSFKYFKGDEMIISSEIREGEATNFGEWLSEKRRSRDASASKHDN